MGNMSGFQDESVSYVVTDRKGSQKNEGFNPDDESFASNSSLDTTCPGCARCEACDVVILQLRRENEKLRDLVEEQDRIKRETTALYSVSAWSLAFKRLPALAITLCMELLGGIVIDQLHKVIKVYTLIVSFMPAISALSGNLG